MSTITMTERGGAYVATTTTKVTPLRVAGAATSLIYGGATLYAVAKNVRGKAAPTAAKLALGAWGLGLVLGAASFILDE